MPDISRIGICLSGGGYRATAFHLGTLKKLHELDVLDKTDIISTISGGSITGACYCTQTETFDTFYDNLYNDLLTKDVIRNVLRSWLGLRFLLLILLLAGALSFLFTRYAWLSPVVIAILIFILLRFQFILFPISKRIEQVYDDFFYQGKTLGMLRKRPTLVIGSTNLQTARPFVFSMYQMQDSTYEFMEDPVKFRPTHFPVARAVMASSCVPFAFTPVVIDAAFFENSEDAKRIHPILVDGGVYDNQGIHKVTQSGRYACDVVITSDAGAGSTGELQFKNTFTLLLETVNVFMSRIKKAQMVRNVYDNASTLKKQVAYFSLGWDVENCIGGFIRNLEKRQITAAVVEAHQLKPEWIASPDRYAAEITAHLQRRIGFEAIEKPDESEKAIARGVSTNLKKLRKDQLDCLIMQAKALTEVQVKLYCPSII